MTKLVVIPFTELKQMIHDTYLEMEMKKQKDAEVRKHAEVLFSINQTAKRLGRSHATIKKLIAQSVLKTTADGKISEQTINEYLKGN